MKVMEVDCQEAYEDGWNDALDEIRETSTQIEELTVNWEDSEKSIKNADDIIKRIYILTHSLSKCHKNNNCMGEYLDKLKKKAGKGGEG